jgi:hypothetical protein
MNVHVCTSLPITTAMSRLDLRIGVSLPGPLRRAGLPRPEPAASGTGRGGASAAASFQRANCTLIARRPRAHARHDQGPCSAISLTWAFVVERVTRIELALSAWEVQQSRPLAALTCRYRCPLVTVTAP